MWATRCEEACQCLSRGYPGRLRQQKQRTSAARACVMLRAVHACACRECVVLRAVRVLRRGLRAVRACACSALRVRLPCVRMPRVRVP